MARGQFNRGGSGSFGSRQAPTHFGVVMDFAGLRKIVARFGQQAQRADIPILDANRILAFRLQQKQAIALQDAIDAHRRAQEYRGHLPLTSAILDKANRRVTIDGFTVGYLDEIKDVAPFWRNLDFGSSIFVGRELRGAFRTAGGSLARPVEGGRDPRFLQFGPIGPLLASGHFDTPRAAAKRGELQHRPAVVRIKNKLPAYDYIRTGYDQWIAAGYAGAEAYAVYGTVFSNAGLDFMARFFDRFGRAPLPQDMFSYDVRQ